MQVRLRGCDSFVVVDVACEGGEKEAQGGGGDIVEEKEFDEEAKEQEVDKQEEKEGEAVEPVAVSLKTLQSGPLPSLLGLTTFKAEPVVVIQQQFEAEGVAMDEEVDSGDTDNATIATKDEGEEEEKMQEGGDSDGTSEQVAEGKEEDQGGEGDQEQKEEENAEKRNAKPRGSWRNEEIFVDVSCNGSDFTSVETCAIIVYDGSLVQDQISTPFARVKGGTQVGQELWMGVIKIQRMKEDLRHIHSLSIRCTLPGHMPTPSSLVTVLWLRSRPRAERASKLPARM